MFFLNNNFILLFFSVAPSAPDMPKVDKVTKNSVTLSWGKPLRDGGSKITGYLIEKKPKGAREWDIINTIPHPDTTFTVSWP